MAARWQSIYSMAVVLLGLVSPIRVAAAQVGISSGVGQVALVARRAAEGSIHAVTPAQQTGRAGQMIEASTMVRLSATSGYQLTVQGLGTSSAKIWVRDVNGTYQELTRGSSVTVARGSHTEGQWESEVQYRVEASQSSELAGPLPVRYEMRINPVM